PCLAALFAAAVLATPHVGPLVEMLAPESARPVYDRESFVALTLDHLILVASAVAIALTLGVGSAIAVTRPAAAAFRPLAEGLVALGQTVPPVAVLGLAV